MNYTAEKKNQYTGSGGPQCKRVRLRRAHCERMCACRRERLCVHRQLTHRHDSRVRSRGELLRSRAGGRIGDAMESNGDRGRCRGDRGKTERCELHILRLERESETGDLMVNLENYLRSIATQCI